MAQRCAYPAFIGLVALLVLGGAEYPRPQALGPHPGGKQASLTTNEAIAVGERLRQEQQQGRILQAGRDPGMVALADCNHYVRNASGAPGLIDQMARDCAGRRPDVEKSHPQLKGEVQKCWGPLDAAIKFLREANDKYVEARKSVDPMRGRLVKEGNEKQQQAKEEIKKCDSCSEQLFKLAADLGATILKEVMAQLDQMRRGQLPSSARAGGTPTPTPGPTYTPTPTPTPTPTRPGDSRTTPAPSFPSEAPCPDQATARSYAEQHQISECRLQQLNARLAPYAQGLQQAGEFSFQMRLAAEELLRAAGQISKAMTDASDVTKHNNVGIGVALGGYLGTLGRLREVMGLAAKEYQMAAATVRAASEQKAALVVANVAKTQAAITAEEAAQVARNVLAELGPPPLTAPGPSPVPPAPESYLATAQFLRSFPGQDKLLPTCGVFACQRVAELLGRNISVFQAFNRIRPTLVGVFEKTVVNGRTVVEFVRVEGGLHVDEIAQGLRSLGVPADVGSGVPSLMNEVRAGRPVIARIRTEAQGANLHAVVIEGMETRSGVQGLTVYDPQGWAYWQALSDWERFFTGVFVRAM